MKKFFLFLLIALAGGALFFYYFIREDEPFTIWQLVPEQSSLVIESKSPAQSWEKFLNSKIGEGYKNTSQYDETVEILAELDSLSGTSNAGDELLSESILISIIPIAQDQFEYLYIIPYKGAETKKMLGNLDKALKNHSSYSFSSRYYQQQEINEVYYAKNKSFAYITYKDHLVISKSSFLVESVIRLINDGYKSNFRVANEKLFRLPSMGGDAGNIYFNFEQLGRLLKTFTNPSSESLFNELGSIKGGGILDLSFDEKAALINGFSLLYDSSSMLTQFDTVSVNATGVINFIPKNAQYILNYKIRHELAGNKEVEKWIGEDISYMTMPTLRSETASRVVFVDARDPGEALNYFNNEALKVAQEDTVYRENYAGYPLTEIAAQEWPKNYFTNLYQPFETTFFTKIGFYFVISEDLEALKIIIEDVENENTWGKDIDLRQFFAHGLEESNLSLIIHPETYWQSLITNVNNTWKERMKSHEQFLKGIVLGILQLNNLDGKYYTSAVIGYEPVKSLSQERNLNSRFIQNFSSKLSSRPYLVKNHESQGFEILIQDTANKMSLVDWDGNLLWSDSLSEPVNDDLYQIDFYKNDKLQYFFAGGNKLFVIDRNGENIEDYPKAIGRNPIEFVNVVDYDNSLNYRFLVADSQGSIFMVDKHGSILDGWTPLKLQGAFSTKPFHVRVRAKDYIIAVQERGIVHVMNRRGEPYKGFPIDLDDRISGEVYMQKGTDAKSSIITIVTEGGKLIKLNLEGMVMQRENLYRPTRESKFHLVPEVQNNGFLIVREGLNRVAILDEKGDRRFEKDYLSVEPLNIQYYNFGAEKEIVAFTDTDQQFTYLYNGTGDLINNQPLNSDQPVAIVYYSSSKKFHLFKKFNNSLTALTF